MNTIKYIDPLFQEMLNQVPKEKRRESELSYGIARRIYDARVTGKREAVVSRWMSGTHNFTIQTLSEIETAMGEEILSVKQYRRLSDMVDGYKVRPHRAPLLNDGGKD